MMLRTSAVDLRPLWIRIGPPKLNIASLLPIHPVMVRNTMMKESKIFICKETPKGLTLKTKFENSPS